MHCNNIYTYYTIYIAYIYIQYIHIYTIYTYIQYIFLKAHRQVCFVIYILNACIYVNFDNLYNYVF